MPTTTTYFGQRTAMTPRQAANSSPPTSSRNGYDGITPRGIEMESNSLSMGDPNVQKSLFDMFNKRGYNLISPSHSTMNCSFTSTASTSSVISFREPIHGQTPTHIAIRRGDLKVIEALLKSDTDLTELRDDHGNTPLHFAVGAPRRISLTTSIRTVALLLQAGANVHAVNHKGRTPIMVHILTMQRDDASILNMLINEGADVNSEVDQVPLLHIAAANNMALLASTLVARGANLHTTNERGLYLHQVATPNVLTSMLAHIKIAQPYLSIDMHHQCMDCRRIVKRKISNPFRWLFRSKNEAINCYHCGWIYCIGCTQIHPLKDTLPSTFHRDIPHESHSKGSRKYDDWYKNIRCCRTCTQILKERLYKRERPHHYR